MTSKSRGKDYNSSSSVSFASDCRVYAQHYEDIDASNGDGPVLHPTTLKVNRWFNHQDDKEGVEETGKGVLDRTPTGRWDKGKEKQPLKGILVNQGYRSQDSTPHSTPRPRIEPEGRSVTAPRAGRYSEGSVLDSAVKAQSTKAKSSTSASVVADFLKKFSPKLGRSKKSLQWYTVDIQPSGGLGNGKVSAGVEPEDHTLQELQNGRISSEFSSEMTECLRHTAAGSMADTTGHTNKNRQTAKEMASPMKARDEADLVRSSNKYIVHLSESTEKSKSKTLPATSSSASASPWHAVVVDIDLDRAPTATRPSGSTGTERLPHRAATDRSEFFQSMGAGRTPPTTTGTPHSYARASAPQPAHLRPLDFHIPDCLQGSASYLAEVRAREDPLSARIPSYIKLSRALNGYSARNMYTSRKLVSSRDYNQLLCKSEEYLNRRSTPTPGATTPQPSFPRSPSRGLPPDVYQAPHSARQARSQSSGPADVRRAASEDRDLSLVGLEPEKDGRGGFDKEQVRKPGHEFLEKLETESRRLRELCDEGNKELLRKDLPDEVAEHLRVAIGKTQLLLSQKFQQFRQLCHKNISESGNEPLKTGTGDLLGFWEMMSIQTADVERMFREVDRLKSQSASQSRLLSAAYQTPSSDGSEPQPLSSSSAASPQTSSRQPHHGVLVSGGAGQRRPSKPKVTFQLNERDVQRKEMIAAKRRAFEEGKRQGSGSGSGSGSGDDTSGAPSVTGTEGPDTAGQQDVQIFLPNASSSAASLQVT